MRDAIGFMLRQRRWNRRNLMEPTRSSKSRYPDLLMHAALHRVLNEKGNILANQVCAGPLSVFESHQ